MACYPTVWAMLGRGVQQAEVEVSLSDAATHVARTDVTRASKRSCPNFCLEMPPCLRDQVLKPLGARDVEPGVPRDIFLGRGSGSYQDWSKQMMVEERLETWNQQLKDQMNSGDSVFFLWRSRQCDSPTKRLAKFHRHHQLTIVLEHHNDVPTFRMEWTKWFVPKKGLIQMVSL